MDQAIHLDAVSDVPLYRQLHRRIRSLVLSGELLPGDRLPATRELAQTLGVNRATVSSAYALLEEDGLIHGHVGRGSFVTSPEEHAQQRGFGEPALSGDLTRDWRELLSSKNSHASSAGEISFATSRPHAGLFPLDAFRESCSEVLGNEMAQTVLQLGSPLGYAPLRQYLLEQAEQELIGRANDDVLITNGCQQGIDLLARALLQPGDTVIVEEPVYPGLKAVLGQARARLVGVPVGDGGVSPADFARVLEQERPKMALLTPNFQNPTGATLTLDARQALLREARSFGVVLVENDLYGQLRYRGEAHPTIKALDESGETILLGSFSKVAFPGLRVGWVIGPRPLIRRLAEIKQATDLHTDQLSQAVLLRFAESGRLAAHLRQVRAAGLAQLQAALDGCARHLPEGSTFTRPDGGLNLWVRLPVPLDAGALLPAAQARGVSYLPARFFSVNRMDDGAFRLSFGGLTPEEIGQGMAILGDLFATELARGARDAATEMATAMV